MNDDMTKVVLVMPATNPVPAVEGGAVQIGVQQLVEWNEECRAIDLAVVSVWSKAAEKEAVSYARTKFYFIKKVETLAGKIFKKIRTALLRLAGYKEFHYEPRYSHEVGKIVRDMNPDYVLVKNAVGFVESISQHYRGRILLQIHNDYLNSKVYRASEIIEACYKVVVNSSYIGDRVLEVSSASNKLVINLNCTDTDLFRPDFDSIARKTLKEELGVLEEEVVLLFTGRLVPEKGVMELVQAVKMLPKALQYKLIIAGGSSFSGNKTTKYIKTLLKLIDSFEKDSVKFVGLWPYDELPKLHAVSDVMIVPSLWEEPAGRVVLEAQSSGLPVIVTDSGGISDYISENSAIVVARGESFVARLSSSIEALIRDPALRSSMGGAGRDFAVKYGSRRYYDEFINFFDK